MRRRLDSFSKSVGVEERIVVLDKFSQKMIKSGHQMKVVRNILVDGIKGRKRRVARSVALNIPLHRSAGQSAVARRKKKLLARSNWFRTSPDDLQEGEDSQSRLPDRVAEGGEKRQRSSQEVNSQESSAKPKNLRTTTVMFIKFSKGGMLQKKMRETLDRVTPLMGFKVMIAEKVPSYPTRTCGVARSVEE